MNWVVIGQALIMFLQNFPTEAAINAVEEFWKKIQAEHAGSGMKAEHDEAFTSAHEAVTNTIAAAREKLDGGASEKKTPQENKESKED